MEPTRRSWEPAGLGLALAAFALLLAEPLVLLGTALIGAAMLAAQYRFLRATLALHADLTVTQTTTKRLVSTDEPVQLGLHARTTRETPLRVEIATDPPVSSRVDGRPPTVTLGSLTEATATAAVSWPVAGTYSLTAPTVTATDPTGWFRTTVSASESVEIDVDPVRPRSIHVGQGGEPVAPAYGEHEGGPFGSGITPAELREYQPGDPARRIDWKATARLASAYVREFEAETDLETAIVLDHRASTAGGPAGATRFDFLRQLALAYVAEARELGDPIGLFAVGDAGITTRRPPAATPAQYDGLRETLLAMEPTEDPTSRRPSGLSPADARRRAHRLDDSPMSERLRPFFAAPQTYVARIRERPLFETVRVFVDRPSTTGLVVLLTDDTGRTEVSETVKLARRGGGQVLAFLAPGALFAPGGLGDLDAAYRAYVDFEEFRRELDGLDRVHVFEVAPGERLSAVLAAGTRRRAPA